MWIVIGIAALYFIYLPFSLFWSGIDKGNGMKRSVTLLKTVKKDLELHKIFARHGMKLTSFFIFLIRRFQFLFLGNQFYSFFKLNSLLC